MFDRQGIYAMSATQIEIWVTNSIFKEYIKNKVLLISINGHAFNSCQK